jgi:WD40 repeat protein/tRNA A-37 threonylcarbamoyl transferase component Bud32
MHDPVDRLAHAVLVRSLDVDAGEREAFVAGACAGDAALEARVRKLISAVDRTQDFLESPALGSRRDEANPDPTALGIHGYRLVRVIASGGMATVFEGVQEQPERVVAIKVMSRALANTSAVRRFRYETEMLAKLQHPGIAQIFEAGTCDDGSGQTLPFFAMEFVGGARTITDHARERGLSIPERLTMLAEVCDAVQHGHHLGIIHRDLKPANILVDGSGRTRIIDFGVARSTSQDQAAITQHADAGKLIGTLNSMSPEQCLSAADVDARTDVYSLGVVLYQLIAGRLPHNLSSVSIPEAVRIITSETPPRLGSIVPAARGDLEAIAMRAMEKDRARRYSSAGAMATDLRRFLNHQTIEARPPSVAHQAALFARRHRVVVASAIALAAVVLGASVFVAAFAYKATVESRRRLIAEQAAIRERDLALRNAYVASIAGALAAAQTGDHTQARHRLAAAPETLRNWEWSLASSLVDRGERSVRAHQRMVTALSSSASGEVLATASQDGSIGVWNAEHGTMLTGIAVASGAGTLAVSISPNGARVAAGCEDKTLRIWDVATGDESGEVAGFDSAVRSVSFSPHGTLATATQSGKGRIWSDWFFQAIHDLNDQPGGVHGVSFSSDGSRLLTWGRSGSVWVRTGDGARVIDKFELGVVPFCGVLSRDGSIAAAGGVDGRFKVWRTTDGAELHCLSTAPSVSTIRSLAISSDGKLLAIGQIDRVIRIWSIETGVEIDTRIGHEEAVSGLQFSPQGDRLHSSSWDGTLRSWPIGPADLSGPLTSLRGHEDHVLSVAYSPDGRLIASGSRDDTVRIWDAAFGEELTVLRGRKADVSAVAFSPDGSLIASAYEDGAVITWLTATGEQVASIGPFPGQANALAFSPDGAHLAIGGLAGVIRVWDVRARSGGCSSSTTLTRRRSTRSATVRMAACSHPAPATARSGSGMPPRALPSGRSPGMSRMCFRWRSPPTAPRSIPVRATRRCGPGILSREWSRQRSPAAASSSRQSRSARTGPGSSRGRGSRRSCSGTSVRDLVASFRGHNSAIRSVAFSPDGRSLVCGGHDGPLTVYDAQPRVERARRLKELRAAKDHAQAAIDVCRT